MSRSCRRESRRQSPRQASSGRIVRRKLFGHLSRCSSSRKPRNGGGLRSHTAPMQACTGSAHNRARLRAYIVYRAGGQRLACVGRGDRFFGVRGQPQRSPPLCRLALARSFALASPLRSVTRTVKPFHQACQRAGPPELSPRRFVTAPGIVRATAPGVPAAAGREFLHAFFALAQRNRFLHVLADPSASCQFVPRAASSFRCRHLPRYESGHLAGRSTCFVLSRHIQHPSGTVSG